MKKSRKEGDGWVAPVLAACAHEDGAHSMRINRPAGLLLAMVMK
jgi:hypothetical protein